MIATRLTLQEAKTRFDIPALWTLLQIPGKPGRSVRCPFHMDRAASFGVYPGNRGGLRWKCFAGCGEGGPVEFVARALDLPDREACRWLLDRAGGESVGSIEVVPRLKPAPMVDPARKLELPPGLRRGSQRDMASVADRRWLSVDGVTLAGERGLLWFASFHGLPAWIVTDAERVNAQARRMDGARWAQIDAKAWTLRGSRATWPIGTREAADKPCVVLTEGGPDLLAAHHFITAEGRESDVAAVGMMGAANRLPDDALRALAGKVVRIFPHADAAGQAAAVRWTEQLETVGCTVDAFCFADLRRADGGAVGDLNDLANLDADCFEAERAELMGVLPR